MVTATKSRKRAGGKSGKPRAKTQASLKAEMLGEFDKLGILAKGKSNGRAKVKGSKDDPGQTYIEGTEPEKIPEIDALVSKYTNFKKASENAKESANDELGKIKSAMEEHDIEFYKTPFGDVSLQHGVTIIKVKLPKAQ